MKCHVQFSPSQWKMNKIHFRKPGSNEEKGTIAASTEKPSQWHGLLFVRPTFLILAQGIIGTKYQSHRDTPSSQARGVFPCVLMTEQPFPW